ncbi:Uncharacterised protein [Bordetella pertussis]|nr:Uncharacterised protein [Bordetella pertussis]
MVVDCCDCWLSMLRLEFGRVWSLDMALCRVYWVYQIQAWPYRTHVEVVTRLASGM